MMHMVGAGDMPVLKLAKNKIPKPCFLGWENVLHN